MKLSMIKSLLLLVKSKKLTKIADQLSDHLRIRLKEIQLDIEDTMFYEMTKEEQKVFALGGADAKRLIDKYLKRWFPKL